MAGFFVPFTFAAKYTFELLNLDLAFWFLDGHMQVKLEKGVGVKTTYEFLGPLFGFVLF
ncbi:hypothetical protein GCM10023189_07040 [Nibrella saemangeumensis]|uniref:Uncharacterized protein n=1 Tax=Nibrella saemangeumensis TaxID=1084526 RepID=A0ABP8MEQ9_9BACT